MTTGTTVVQTRLSQGDVSDLDEDLKILGFKNRSEALRASLRLLHRQARHAGLAKEYDDFYGADSSAPLTGWTAVGDQVAAETISAREAG